MKLDQHKTLLIVNAVGYTILVYAQMFAPFRRSTRDVSANFETPLTPAGWAFSIWGPIFLLQGAGVVASIVSKEEVVATVVDRIGYAWFVGWLVEDLWQIVFSQASPAGMWVCLALLISSLAAFAYAMLRLDIYKPTYPLQRSPIPAERKLPMWVALLYRGSTALNAGWVSVATSLGIMIGLRGAGVSYESLVPLSAVLAIVVTGAALARMYFKGDAVYSGAVVWALIAVSLRPGVLPAVKSTAIACAVVLGVALAALAVQTALRMQRERQLAGSSVAGAGEEEAGGTVAESDEQLQNKLLPTKSLSSSSA